MYQNRNWEVCPNCGATIEIFECSQTYAFKYIHGKNVFNISYEDLRNATSLNDIIDFWLALIH